MSKSIKKTFQLYGNRLDGSGCMAALDAEHYLQVVGAQEGKTD